MVDHKLITFLQNKCNFANNEFKWFAIILEITTTDTFTSGPPIPRI
jgi:hypothetical protein